MLLECEYRNSQPAISLIYSGRNDLKVLNTTQDEEQLRLIVETTLRRGIIPVLSTFSSNPDLDTWFQAVRFNLIILDVAEAYDIPVINLWSAARALPRYGIGDDNIHLTSAGASVKFGSNEFPLLISLQNLIVLHTLDAIRQKLESDDAE